MAEHLEKGSYKIAIGVGGAFDYLSGSVSRAPSWIRSMGFEWLYRLIRQPWRWKRQLALLGFISLVMKEKFSIG
jgi:N-acetylglucosaminyldiphosphoundecaprenol N-acetyl-beta-D-mannosaminyltransferase